MSNNNDKQKTPITKKKKFTVERQHMLDRLYTILGITETNKIIDINELDNNIEKKNLITSLADDVRKYFRTGNWVYYTKEGISKPYLSLAKSIIKDMGHKTVIVYEIGPNKETKKGLKII